MLIDVNGPRNTEVMALTELRLIARASSTMMMMMMVRLLWKMAAAAEHVDSGCWSAGVYDAFNTQEGPGTYLLPVVGRYMVDCLGSAWCYISPFYVLSNPLQIWFMSESCSPWCCRRRTLTRESDWLFVLSIIREYIQFTPFITPGPSDKWWGGLL